MTQEQLTRLHSNLVDAEGDRLYPYVDTVGKITIGVGHNLTDCGISAQVRELLLVEDIDRAVADLDEKLPWWRELDPVRQVALVELVFNMGIGGPTKGLLSFRNTLAHLRAGRYEQAAVNLAKSKWARDVGPRRTARLQRMIRTGA